MKTDPVSSQSNSKTEFSVSDFNAQYALAALDNTNVYFFRYFPKLKMIVLTERLQKSLHLDPVYYDMPESFSNSFVAKEYRAAFEKMYRDINAGELSSNAFFKGRSNTTWYRVTLTTAEWDEEHRPELCVGVVEVHSEEELMHRLDTVMDGVSGGFQITHDDSSFTYIYVSDGIAALQGYTVSELIKITEGNSLRNIYTDDQRDYAERKRRIAQDSNTYTVKYRLPHKDGGLIWVSETGKKLLNESGSPVYYCLIQDITESQKRVEELRNILSMQQQMADSLSCGIMAYTLPEREILISNYEVKRMFNYGLAEKEPLINVMLERILPEDHVNIRNAVRNLTEAGSSCSYRLHPITADGTRLTVECTTKLLAFGDDRQYILSVISDITKLEEQNNALSKERKQYRDAFVFGSEYSYRFDVTDGMVYTDFDYSVRGNLEANLGLTVPVSFDTMIQRWLDTMKPEFLTPPEQNPMSTADVMRCYEKGMRNIISEYYNAVEEKYFRRIILLSEDDENGHIYAVAIVRDISEVIRKETRKRNELAMINRDLREQISISKAFSSFYFATWEVDLVNNTMSEIVTPDWGREIIRNRKGNARLCIKDLIDLYVSKESAEETRKFADIDTMADRLQNENVLATEYEGSHFGWSTVYLIPYMRDERGKVLKVIFAIREISNEKRLELNAKQALEEAYEAADRANAAKTEFLSNISHDIRTPMNGIIGMTAIAGTHLDDRERVADCLSKISASSKHLLGLINEVLDMSKIESGKLDLNMEAFSLSELIETLITMNKAHMQSKNHDFSVNINGLEHEKVIGDSIRIQQVFVNLLSNAIKYTPEGGKISLSLTEKPTNNPKIGYFEFIVEDNGIGMSEEFQTQLFEPFTRANDKRISGIQGTGLGMPITRNIVRMMNGDIKVESELSKGSKFTVTFYLELPESENDFSIKEFLHLPVLVADDEQSSCETTCEILRELGMDGEWVLTGNEAVEKTVSRHKAGKDYFAVILDWKMPEMDGLETAKAIRRNVGDNIPIIIISAYAWSDIEQEARAAGVNAFISKPVFKSRVAYLFKNLLGCDPKPQNASAVNDLAKENFTGKRALLVEDNELNTEIAKELLSMTGLMVDTAQNGKEAVDCVVNHARGYYDIIFMDVQMPVMNGYEATRAIRSLPGIYEKQVPIIAMTANAFAEDVLAAKNSGMNEHIAKPLNIPQLIKSLEHWLK